MSDSSESSSDRSERLHNEGQEDGAKGNSHYDRPHGSLSTVLSDTVSKSKDNDDYDAGFTHGKSQR